MSVVLAVGAHPDDVELGAGGTLARHAIEGDEVHILVLASQPNEDLDADRMARARDHAAVAAGDLGAHELLLYDGRDQALDVMPRLALVRWVEQVIATCRPSIVYTHDAGDRNLDHRIVHDAVLTACRPVPGRPVRQLYTFEVPSSSEWGSGFEPNTFFEVTGDAFLKKLKALARYEEELRDFPHPRSVAAISALATWRGASAGLLMAEAFRLIRRIA